MKRFQIAGHAKALSRAHADSTCVRIVHQNRRGREIHPPLRRQIPLFKRLPVKVENLTRPEHIQLNNIIMHLDVVAQLTAHKIHFMQLTAIRAAVLLIKHHQMTPVISRRSQIIAELKECI